MGYFLGINEALRSIRLDHEYNGLLLKYPLESY